MKAYKTILCVLTAAVLCLTLVSCMNGADNAKPQTTVRTGYMPETTNVPMDAIRDTVENVQGSVQGATQAPVSFDWLTGSGQIEGNVNRISEVSDCRVVVSGDTALVGVKFTPAYQGEVTERIREMIASEVMKADASIKTVAVTAEQEDVAAVWDISEKLRSGTPAETLTGRIDEIVRNATTLR